MNSLRNTLKATPGGENSPCLSRVAGLVFSLGFVCLAACRPSPAPPALRSPSPAPGGGASVVSIPEEFRTPPPLAHPTKPLLPRVVFVTSDFQVTTQHGIQGISAGEAVNFIRQTGEDYVVEYAGIEFKKNKTYFSPTFVNPSAPQPTPLALATPPSPKESLGPAEPALPDEPNLGQGPAAPPPAPTAEQKKIGMLTGSIRALNEEIRAAQEDLARAVAPIPGKDKPSASDIKKAERGIQKLKGKRDALSAQLTEIGKP